MESSFDPHRTCNNQTTSWGSEVHVSNGRVRLPQGSQTHGLWTSAAYFNNPVTYALVSVLSAPVRRCAKGITAHRFYVSYGRCSHPSIVFWAVLLKVRSQSWGGTVHLGAGWRCRLPRRVACTRRLPSRPYLSQVPRRGGPLSIADLMGFNPYTL